MPVPSVPPDPLPVFAAAAVELDDGNSPRVPPPAPPFAATVLGVAPPPPPPQVLEVPVIPHTIPSPPCDETPGADAGLPLL